MKRAMDQDQLHAEFDRHLDLLTNGEVHLCVERLKGLSYHDKLSMLKIEWRSLLCSIIYKINSPGYVKGKDNPIKLILDEILPRDRLMVVSVGYRGETSLYAACICDDVETMTCIIESLPDPEQLNTLFFHRYSFYPTILHAAADRATKNTMAYLVTCVSVKTIIRALKEEACAVGHPLASLLERRQYTAGLTLLRCFSEGDDDHKSGIPGSLSFLDF